VLISDTELMVREVRQSLKAGQAEWIGRAVDKALEECGIAPPDPDEPRHIELESLGATQRAFEAVFGGKTLTWSSLDVGIRGMPGQARALQGRD